MRATVEYFLAAKQRDCDSSNGTFRSHHAWNSMTALVVALPDSTAKSGEHSSLPVPVHSN